MPQMLPQLLTSLVPAGLGLAGAFTHNPILSALGGGMGAFGKLFPQGTPPFMPGGGNNNSLPNWATLINAKQGMTPQGLAAPQAPDISGMLSQQMPDLSQYLPDAMSGITTTPSYGSSE